MDEKISNHHRGDFRQKSRYLPKFLKEPAYEYHHHRPAQNLTGKDPIVIDARGGNRRLERYNAAHLENAQFVDLETDLSEKTDDPSSGGRHPLPKPEDFGRFLGILGISPSSTVVVYDDKGANASARFWWMLKGGRAPRRCMW